MKHHTVIVLALSLTLFAVGCGDGAEQTGSVSYPATVTFGADEGVDMVDGEHMVPGNFANSDLFAQANGDDLKCSTGGPNAIHLRAAEWFKTGGFADVFSGLDMVPNTPLPTGEGLPLILPLCCDPCGARLTTQTCYRTSLLVRKAMGVELG